MPSILNATTTSGLVTSADNSGSLQLQTNNGTTALTIDTSQNVGIGTSSPGSQKLHVRATSPTEPMVRAISVTPTGNGVYGQYNAKYDGTASDWYFGQGSTGAWSFWNNDGSVNERMRLTSDGNLQFNSGYGSVATAYGCRAWVNYNAVSASIRGSGNVSSVTNNGAGDNTVNFTTAMPDVNYSWSIMQQLNGTGNNDVGASSTARNQGTNAWGTGFLRILTMSHSNTSQENPLVLTVAVFR